MENNSGGLLPILDESTFARIWEKISNSIDQEPTLKEFAVKQFLESAPARAYRLEDYAMAALSIGCTVTQNTAGGISVHGPLRWDDWNPVDLSNDSLDLAVRANICFQRYRSSNHSEAVGIAPGGLPITVRVNDAAFGGDANAASREAIFRVAMAIGREIKSREAA